MKVVTKLVEIGRARNDYECNGCGRIIKKGEIYERLQKRLARSLKGYNNLKFCKECSIAKDYNPENMRRYYDRLESKYAHLQRSEETGEE